MLLFMQAIKVVTAVIAKEKTQVGALPILVRDSRDAARCWSLDVSLRYTAREVGDVSIDRDINLRHDFVVLLIAPLSNFSKGASYYALSKKLMPEHYQMLMDRGWRR